jgi:hypothetical protein
MTHVRYWAMTLMVALAGAFITISRFAFSAGHAIWIAFAVAIAATVCSLGATAVALVRSNHLFSGISAVCALFAAWTIIATRTLARPTALWVAFASGVALALLSLRALALHETTVERVVHALELNDSGEGTLAIRRGSTQAMTAPPSSGTGFQISSVMRSWLYWLSHTCLAVVGAFVVLATFAWHNPAQGVSVRWSAFGLGIIAAVVALTALVESGMTVRSEGPNPARRAAMLITGASTLIAMGLIVLMLLMHGSEARWWAFGLGCGLVGMSLLASTIHELSSERVRHELEVEQATATAVPPATEAAH